MTPPAISWHRRLPVRFFAAIMIVAAFAVAATAWLAVETTREAIKQGQGRAVANNKEVYDGLIGYAATHAGWAAAGPVITRLARRTGLRLTLVAPGATLDSSDGGKLPSGSPITVDPLDVDASLDPDADAQRIDNRAVGPFLLSAEARAQLLDRAQTQARCDEKLGTTVRVVTSPSGRSYADAQSSTHDDRCRSRTITFPSEAAAVKQLQAPFAGCLPLSSRRLYEVGYAVSTVQAPRVTVTDGRTVWTTADEIPAPAGDCLAFARRRVLTPYVAPAAQLRLTGEAGQQVSATAVPHVSAERIALVAVVVLGLAGVVAGTGAVRFGTSLRSVTLAAQRMRRGDAGARVPIRTRRGRRRRDDLTELAVAFNDMATSVEDGERQQRNMIADVSHELRTPLTNITGWVEAMQDGVVEPDPRTLAVVAEQAHQLGRVIDDLRDLALAEADQLRLHPESVTPADLVAQVSAAFAVQAREAGISLTSSIETDEPVRADPVRLVQCLSNLVANALVYTAAGGRVVVTARRTPDHVVLDVTDDGVGISGTDLPHVFDRLWRAERSRTRGAGGSGLGLAIARGIARAHGGDLTVTSVEGSGSTFSLAIPRAERGELPTQ